MLGAFLVWAASLKIPDIGSLSERKVTQSTKIYDRTGTVLLMDLGENVTRTVVSGGDVSPFVKNATVAIEDSSFYEHHGIKIKAILRAILANLVPGGYTQGGSTITQQVVKNTILTTDKTIARKLKEWVLAVRLEQALSKDQILATYLNESPYGGSIYGVEEAAEAYFGKHASDVTLAEAAYLAALPQAPTYYSPYGNHRAALETRKGLVLSRMKELGFISDPEYEAARAESVEFAPQRVVGIRAPHFSFYVREQLEREFGQSALEQKGWKVITTLDTGMQADAEETLSGFAASNLEQFNASNAALVALDPVSGDILAMMGSRDYFATDIPGAYNVATALPGRQPGSAFKPFVYAAAFLMGYTPDTILFDVPTQFSTFCQPSDNHNDEPPCYAPKDYDEKYRGPMAIRDALAQSINIPAVKALYLVGIESAIRLAQSLGISTLDDPGRYGLTLVLGGGEVTLLDMVSAYGVFANEGVRVAPRAVLRIEDRAGAVVKSYDPLPARVLDQNVALEVTDVLSDNQAKLPAYGAGSLIFFPGFHVASKTGTTDDTRDAWIIGYTSKLVVGTWAGNNDNTPMVKKVAGLIVVPMWHDFFAKELAKIGDTPFPEPRDTAAETDKPVLRGIWEGGDIIRVNALNNQPVDQSFASPTKERITVSVHDILYWLDKKNPRGPRLENPGDDPQFAAWEFSVREWAREHGYADGTTIFR
jgi:1A family penicillin-binding protein